VRLPRAPTADRFNARSTSPVTINGMTSIAHRHRVALPLWWADYVLCGADRLHNAAPIPAFFGGSRGESIADATRQIGVTEGTYHHRREAGQLKKNEVRPPGTPKAPEVVWIARVPPRRNLLRRFTASRSDGLGCPWGALMHVTLKVVLETALRVRDVRSR
jgi:hypothetical protein